MGPHPRSRKFSRPHMMSRRAGMQGADPIQCSSKVQDSAAKASMLGVCTRVSGL